MSVEINISYINRIFVYFFVLSFIPYNHNFNQFNVQYPSIA
jgi:hypothetical protein